MSLWQTLKRSEGFTLLETLIAMTIMVIAMSAILAVQDASINASGRARTMTIVGMLARGTMVEFEQKFEGKTFEEFKKEESGTYPAPYQDYRWEMKLKEVEFPNIVGAGGGGEKKEGAQGGDDGNAAMVEKIAKLITKFLSKAIREVNVTVIWSRSGKEQKFNVATYWVNLNQEFSLNE